MKIKCDYCGSFINDTDEKCSYCNATNEHLVRTSIEIPKTIDELKQWYTEMNLPENEVTRFFIGIDYKSPKAFGIYKDDQTNEFIVYKNKSDGTRSIRYKGKDESYAVNELYIKLKEEIINQKEEIRKNKGNNASNYNYSRNLSHLPPNNTKSSISHTLKIILSLFITQILFYGIVLIIGLILTFTTPQNGYYTYNDSYYYCQSGDWYKYTEDSWTPTTVNDELKNNFNSYKSSYSSTYDIEKFEDSNYYIKPSSSDSSNSKDKKSKSSSYDSDWDSSSKWDSSDSWDSDYSDWDSDW